MFPDCLPESSERIVAIQGNAREMNFIDSRGCKQHKKYFCTKLIETDFLGTPDHIVDCVHNICDTLREVKKEHSLLELCG